MKDTSQPAHSIEFVQDLERQIAAKDKELSDLREALTEVSRYLVKQGNKGKWAKRIYELVSAVLSKHKSSEA